MDKEDCLELLKYIGLGFFYTGFILLPIAIAILVVVGLLLLAKSGILGLILAVILTIIIISAVCYFLDRAQGGIWWI